MPSAAKPTATFAALALVAAALAGCTATTTSHAADASRGPSAAPSRAETDADDCSDPARINLGNQGASLTGDLVDRGPRDLAAGAVGLDAEGRIVSYTVAPGDAPEAIGERLCIENAISLAELNHTRTIHPDQVLRLNPDPTVAWVPYYNPHDAPAGFQQIPYQRAIEAMGTAADAGDVESMRAIWAHELSGMFTNQADIDVIAQALDAGNLDVLGQMFS